ncbi:MAG: penicillin-binding protein 2 [Clostridia bacterium]|nr:penicillin-binding protein 2 [Clostridia bacterium]
MNNKKIAHMLAVISVMFLALIVYMTAFDMVHHDKYASDTSTDREKYVRRGTIYDRNKVVLAESTGELNNQERLYPYKNRYAHIIGFKSRRYGVSEIEKRYNNELMGSSSAPVTGDLVTLYEDIKSMFDKKEEQQGADITLTIDNNLQKVCYDALGSYKGAIVAMNPKTGEIYAMVSKPDFDPTPDNLEKNYDKITSIDKSFVRKCTNETYFPGSTFKVITTAAMIENGMDDFTFDDTGELTVKIKNYGEGEGKFLGETNLETGFKNSSNIYFSEAANELGKEALLNTARDFLFEESIDFDKLGMAKSKLPAEVASPGDITNTALGQGDVQASPLHLAMISSAIANDGVMMQPYVIKQISGAAGFKAKPKELAVCIKGSTAERLKELMKLCVSHGTGTAAAIYGKDVCGKTGTAEVDVERGIAHALFIGFAPYDDPEIAICVVVENLPHKNTGGTVAAPIARKVLQKYFELK